MTNDKINIDQIRIVTQVNGKEPTFNVTQKINTFFQDVLTFQPGIENEKNEQILQSDVTFVQMREILKLVDPSLVEKIPEKLRNFISSYKSFINYTFEYAIDRTLDNQFIYDDTKSLIAFFDYSYWATEEDKKLIELAWLDKDRESEYDFSSKENHVSYTEDNKDNNTVEVADNSIEVVPGDVSSNIYSTDNQSEPVLVNSSIENNTQTIENSSNNNSLVSTDESDNTQEYGLMVRKENFFTRIINKIKSFFYRKRNETEIEEI